MLRRCGRVLVMLGGRRGGTATTGSGITATHDRRHVAVRLARTVRGGRDHSGASAVTGGSRRLDLTVARAPPGAVVGLGCGDADRGRRPVPPLCRGGGGGVRVRGRGRVGNADRAVRIRLALPVVEVE